MTCCPSRSRRRILPKGIPAAVFPPELSMCFLLGESGQRRSRSRLSWVVVANSEETGSPYPASVPGQRPNRSGQNRVFRLCKKCATFVQ